jgi:hypothetical protein
LANQAKSRANLLKNAAAKEQRIIELEEELKEVWDAAAAEKKKLEDELIEEKCKDNEATAQFNALTIGKVEICIDCLVRAALMSSCGILIFMSCRFPQS